MLVGDVVLKNGDKIHWIAKNIEIQNVFEMMASVHNAELEFNVIFGDNS